MKTKNKEYVEKFLSNVFTERDKFAIEYLSKVFLEFNMDFTPVPVINAQKAKKIITPIHLFAAENDILFPGKKMIKRAKQIFPSLKQTKLFYGSKHVQNQAENRIIEEVILEK